MEAVVELAGEPSIEPEGDPARRAFARLVTLAAGRPIGRMEDYPHRSEIVPGVTLLGASAPMLDPKRSGLLRVTGRGPDSFVFIGADVGYPLAIRCNGAGNVVFLGERCNLRGGFIQAAGDGNTVFVGASTTMALRSSINVHGPGGAILVGERCVLYEDALLGNSDTHGIYDAATGRRLNHDRPIHVDDDVRIGRFALIGKGVTIGAGARIEPRAVVSGAIPAGARVAGNPARPVVPDGSGGSEPTERRSPRPASSRVAPAERRREGAGTLDDALAMLADLGAGRQFDPAAPYRPFPHGSDVGIFVCEGATFAPRSVVASGEANTILLGSGANPKLFSVTFAGSDNVVFFGPRSKAAGLAVDIRGHRNRLYVGADTTTVSGTVTIEGDDRTVLVGDRCMLSSRIILGGDGRDDDRGADQGDVLVGDDVWIGRYAALRPGTFVGDGAVIGQGAVVDGPLDGGCIHAGAPARTLRRGIVWNRYNRDTLEEAQAVPELLRQAKLQQAARREAEQAKRAKNALLRADRAAEQARAQEEAERIRVQQEEAAALQHALALRRFTERRRRRRRLRIALWASGVAAPMLLIGWWLG